MRAPAIANLRRYIANPIAFVREVCGAEPDAWQLDVLGAASRERRQAIVGSKGCGKTTLLAWLILWFLFTRPRANIAVTSISGDNLKDGLWKELSVWMHRAPAIAAAFEWQSSRIVSRLDPAGWFVSARTYPKSADTQQQSQTLAGLHADYTMFVIDEAGSVPQAVAVTAEAALASGIECRLILGRNPTSPDGPLYHAAVTHRQHWHVVTVTGDPDDPKRSPRVSIEWARQQISAYGRDNPWCLVNVLGRFPPAAINALLGVEEVTAAMHRHLRPDQYDWSQKRLGIDCSRFGDDLTVLFPRQGLAAFKPVTMRHERNSSVSVDVANRILAARARWGTDQEFLDATGGFAAGTIDILRAQGLGPIDIQFHAPAHDSRYANRRAELYFELASWIHRGGALPHIDEMIAELSTLTFTFNTQGKFLLESKNQVKARLGRSPDRSDALACTFGLPEMPRGMVTAGGSIGKVLCDFDPYAEIR